MKVADIKALFSSGVQPIQQQEEKKRIEAEKAAQKVEGEPMISSDEESNINTQVLNTQEKFLEDVITNLSGDSIDTEKPICKKKTNQFEKQFNELQFNHEGIPETMQSSKQILNIFNDKIAFAPQSNFNPTGDGRFNVTKDMTHNNMAPSFSSKSYGFNPMMDKEMTNYSVRKIELFSGSDQNPQFKHKSEVKALFDPVTNKVDSVTGSPNFSDFYESRYIPSDKRQNERPFQPVMITPGLNLGYNPNLVGVSGMKLPSVS
jgi:hypothetical protein